MPHSKQPGSALDWLAWARGDLALAGAVLPPGAFLEDLCFHAQQAAEKALKGILIHHGIAFRYTHDLDELATSLKKAGVNLPEEVEEATILTTFAWETRYPGTGEPVTNEEHQEAVTMARSVVEWAMSALRKE